MESSKTKKIFGHLTGTVNQNLCLNCGACVASCPWDSIKLLDGRATLSGKCTACGLCYAQCPQTVTDEKLAEKIFGSTFSSPVGHYIEAYSGQAENPDLREEGQERGVVTSLLRFLYEKKLIDGAVVMDRDSEWKPEPRVAVTPKELIDFSRASYTSGPLLTAVRKAVDCYLLEKMVVVGHPCQVRAIRVMEKEKPILRKITSRIELILGLYCQRCFSYDDLFIEKLKEELNVNPSDILEIDLTNDESLTIRTDDSKFEMTLDSIDDCMFEPCRLCDDYSARFADISVGASSPDTEHSTVLIRTPRGKEIIEEILDKGIFKIKRLGKTDPALKAVEKRSLKKERSLEKEIQSRREEGKSLPPRLSDRL